jgi:PIN domain
VTVVVFLDTMIFLHCRPVREIDWCAEVAASEVRIVVPRITIRELDKHKNSHPSAKVKKRAGEIARWLVSCHETSPSEVRPNVTLEFQGLTPAFDFEAAQLDRTQNDDQLIASMLTFRASDATTRLVLVSQDAGPRMTATDCGLGAIALSDQWRLAPEQDPVIKENEQLRAELKALQSAQPKLRVHFVGNDGEQGCTYIDVPAPISDVAPTEAWTAALAAESLAVPERHVGDRQPIMPETRRHSAGRPMVTVTHAIMPPTEAEYRRYAAERSAYLSAFTTFQRERWEYERRCARLTDLALILCNDGTAVADDVDIELVVESPVVILLPDIATSLRKAPGPPTRPVAPRTKQRGFFTDLDPHGMFRDEAARVSSNLFPVPEFRWSSVRSTPKAKEVTRYQVDGTTVAAWHVTRAKHGVDEPLPPVTICWPSHAQMASLTLRVTIRAASVPKAVTSKLHVRVLRTSSERSMSED